MLKGIEMAGFRGVWRARASFDETAAIVGSSGSGKTALLEAMNFLRLVAESDSDVAVYIGRLNEGFRHWDLAPDGVVSIKAESDWGAHFGVEIESSGRARIEGGMNDGRKDFQSVLRGRDFGYMGKIRRVMSACGANMAAALKSLRVYNFDDISYLTGTSEPGDCHWLRADGKNLPSWLNLMKVKRAPAFDRLNAAVREALPFIGEVSPVRDDYGFFRLKWREASGKRLIDCAYLPAGALRFIAVASLLTADEKMRSPVILLDCPFAGMDGAAVEKIGDLAYERARSGSGSQLIYSARSFEEASLDAIPLRSLVVSTRVYRGARYARMDDRRAGALIAGDEDIRDARYLVDDGIACEAAMGIAEARYSRLKIAGDLRE